MYTNKHKNLDEIYKFTEKQKLQNVIQSFGPCPLKKIKFVVKNLPVKNMLSPHDYVGKFYYCVRRK